MQLTARIAYYALRVIICNLLVSVWNNILAVAMPDAVLVATVRAQDVKQVVEVLKQNKITQAEIFPKDYRPWGWFERLALGDHFQVKRICVKPGAALSLQSHRYRSEHDCS